MARLCLIAFCVIVAAAALLAQEEFAPGTEDTLKWVEPEEGLKAMLEDVKPGFLYVYSSHKAEFCRAVEKDVIPSKTINRKFAKFVCMKLSSDAENDLLDKYKLELGEAAALFLDSQGKLVQAIKEKPETSGFSSALRKAEKVNKEIEKFLDAIEKNYKKGDAYLKKQLFFRATQHFQAILKARDDYIEKKGEISSPYFEKAEKKIEQIEEEGTKLLIQANAAIMKNDFANGSVILSKLRTEFALFPDIIKKVEQAEQELQRRMQQAQQQQGK